MKRMPARVLRATALVSALALVACSNDDPTDPGIGIPAGTFTATLTGDFTESFSGAAIQGEVLVNTSPVWILELGASNSIFLAINGARPPNGTYQITADLTDWPAGEWIGNLTLDHGPADGYFGGITSGTVTITSSSAELVEGSYNFQVSDGNTNPVVATVTGSFSALAGTVSLGIQAGQLMRLRQ